MPRLLARFDVAVAPYLPLDGFYFNPLKIVEYMVAGKPVVYPDQGDLRELVGPAGTMYRPGSAFELADRLSQLLERPALRRHLAGHAAVRGARLDWSVIAERVLEFAGGLRASAVEESRASAPAIGSGHRDLAAGAP